MKTVIEILSTIQSEAKKNDVNLTYANKMVYLKMIEYGLAKSHENYKVWLRFYATNAELTEYCNVAPRIITDTIRKLEKCGVLKYSINSPKPTSFTLMKKYFE